MFTGLRQFKSIFIVLCVLLALVALAAACGGSDAPAASGAGNEQPQSQDNNGFNNEAQGAGEEQAAAGESQTRVVVDAFGETEVPANPQRIVVLTTAALDNLLALGVKPVGAPYIVSVNANFFKYMADQTEGIENTGTVDQPNLETIAKLQPDLIIGQKSEHEAVYEELKRIAPVYFTDKVVDQWKAAFLGNADAVGKSEQAEALIRQYEENIAQFQTVAGDKLTAGTVSLIRPRSDHIRLHLGESFSGAVALEAGLQFPAAVQGQSGHHVAITEEQIGDMDADYIISFGRESEAEFFNEKIVKNPIWATLAAVQNDQVHMVDWEVWLSGQGIQAANLIVDDLTRIFAQ